MAIYNTDAKNTRGYRNNNPLNIRHNKSFMWQGEMVADNDGFCRFRSTTYGLRAAFCIIRSYNIRHGIYTVADIITRFAPPSENHTDKYIAFICSRTGFTPDTEIRYNDQKAKSLIQAMAFYESKMVFSLDFLNEAYKYINR